MLRTNLAPLDTYLADAMSLAGAEFLDRYPWPMLVVPEPSPDVLVRIRRPETVIEDAANQSTTKINLNPRTLKGASLDALCLEVRPRRGGNGNRVSIGRSPEADVVLLDESVSRFHAEISWGTDRSQCVLKDLGARNSTLLEARPVTANVRIPLSSGMVLTFGALPTRFYTPEAFLEWVATGAPRAGASPGKWPDRP
ncbi:MAG: FHA domain-containing protein [Deltaproteobacteria bacterium]|jgi:hypothetical protein|nr:FHA domain-containing protein [Deltaproteobacteria bacterium]